MTETRELSLREQAIRDFVRANPGCKKQQVRDAMQEKGIASSVTTYNILKQLIEDGMVKQIRDKPNSIPIRLYVNDESLLVTLNRNLGEFERSYLKVVNALLGMFLSDIRASRKNIETIGKIRTQLLSVINSVTFLYVFHATTVWPARIKDKQLLERMIATTFRRMAEIRYESLKPLSVLMRKDYLLVYSRYMQKLLKGMVSSQQELTDFCNRNGLSKELEVISRMADEDKLLLVIEDEPVGK